MKYIIDNTKSIEKIENYKIEEPKVEIVYKRDKEKIINERNAYLRNLFKKELGRDITPEEFDRYIELSENKEINFWTYLKELKKNENNTLSDKCNV